MRRWTFTGDGAAFRPESVHKAIGQAFRKEFLNRLDRVIVFRPLSRETMRAILRKELDDVLRGHCERVGRDQSEIDRSVHLPFDPDHAPAKNAERASEFFDAGVDIVVWSMRGPVDARRLEPLGDALR